MSDELTYGVGGAILLGALALVLKMKPWQTSGRQAEKSGEKSPEYWELKIEQLVEAGVRKAMAGRNDELRRIMREEFSAAQRGRR